MHLIREFHRAFGQPIYGQPFMPDIKRVTLRERLIREEFEEVMEEFALIRAHQSRGYRSAREVYEDIARLAKELADVEVVVQGTALEFGIPLDRVYAEVHRSNMSKLGADGKPLRRHDGKVLKGPNYSEADTMSAIGIMEGTTSP
jgi:predicted HAD superfamily Cof-like phosphohydrolase